MKATHRVGLREFDVTPRGELPANQHFTRRFRRRSSFFFIILFFASTVAVSAATALVTAAEARTVVIP